MEFTPPPRKSLIISLLCLLGLIVISCKEKFASENLPNTVQNPDNHSTARINPINTKLVNFKGLNASIPIEYPSDLISFTSNDYQEICFNKSKKSIFKVKGIEGNTLSKIIKSVYKKYPNFDKFDVKEYQKFFPTLSEKELLKNSEIAMEFVDKLMGYEISSAFSQLENGKFSLDDEPIVKNGKVNGSEALNDVAQSICFIFILMEHPRINVDGVKFANSKGSSLASEYEPNIGELKSNALRHGIWATLIAKHGLYRYSDVGKVINIALSITICHEIGPNSLDSDIDMHNNFFSAFYYLPNNIRVKGPWYDRNTAVDKTDEQIAQEVANNSMAHVNTSAEINNFGMSVLVY